MAPSLNVLRSGIQQSFRRQKKGEGADDGIMFGGEPLPKRRSLPHLLRLRYAASQSLQPVSRSLTDMSEGKKDPSIVAPPSPSSTTDLSTVHMTSPTSLSWCPPPTSPSSNRNSTPTPRRASSTTTTTESSCSPIPTPPLFTVSASGGECSKDTSSRRCSSTEDILDEYESIMEDYPDDYDRREGVTTTVTGWE